MKKNNQLAQRLALILSKLNQGVRLDVHQLSEEFGVSLRTIQRDINRFDFLEWEEKGARYYKINRQRLGFLTEEDIQRFALFVSVADLFPKIDQQFYQEKLTQSVQIKGFQYESIHHLEQEFNLLQKAIQQHNFISFKYKKLNTEEGKYYQIAPYSLINKNGIWYLIGTDQDKQKTFCFTQLSAVEILDEFFTPNPQLLEEITKNDSISHGNQLSEVIIKVSAFAAPYFLRRNLLPNQKLVHKAENGELILSSENVHELDVVPLVQYWIPHLTIISPSELQGRMIEKLQSYLSTTNN
ncbi:MULTISPECIES: YafY family protein [unclassified Pasteurella]|uniref:helix-turn-helix transcriptional regulator n=1 Tax=unclassified Pasteurella TaxID=2621516 RepID=UPI0010738BA1|nr:WYL domain-containing protein [Pasteurella sp. 19428wF3_WM03]TFU52563.1 WYL domain-containing protein [Pasteurella sp. WM03]